MSLLARSGKAELSNAPSQGLEDSMFCRSKTGAIIQGIPIEVMVMIFGMLGSRDCAVGAVVCRRWSGAALDELWRSLSSLLPLFQLLGPLEYTHLGYDLHHDVAVTAESWDLFKSYGARVRHLTYDGGKYAGGISNGLITRALAVHPDGGILPNLRAVVWDIDEFGLKNVLAFCPLSLERMNLQISSGRVPVDQVERLLFDLSSSLANRLKSFDFGTYLDSSEDAAISTALNAFLKTQRSLRELKFPWFHIHDVTTISEACQASEQLRTFCGEMRDFTSEKLQLALNALARSGHSLRCIRLARSESGMPEETMRLADIEPLLQLSAAEEVGFWFDFKLHLGVQDIQRMGQAWGKLVSLILHSDRGSRFHLSHLVTFAESFPALEEFAASFECAGDIPVTNGVPSRFKCLRRLTLLGTFVESQTAKPLAEFLTMVCGPEVTVGIRRNGLRCDEVLRCSFDWDQSWPREQAGELRRWMAKLYREEEATAAGTLIQG